MIDGGQEDYFRYSGGVVKEAKVEDLIDILRERVNWTSN